MVKGVWEDSFYFFRYQKIKYQAFLCAKIKKFIIIPYLRRDF